jgi:hypothetical protein
MIRYDSGIEYMEGSPSSNIRCESRQWGTSGVVPSTPLPQYPLSAISSEYKETSVEYERERRGGGIRDGSARCIF